MLLHGNRVYWRLIPKDSTGLLTVNGEWFATKGLPIVYPMDLRKVTMGETVIYDKDSPGPPWFLLDLDCSKNFIPADADRFITADSLVLRSMSRLRKTSKKGV